MNWLLFLFITSFLTFLFITFLFVNFLPVSYTSQISDGKKPLIFFTGPLNHRKNKSVNFLLSSSGKQKSSALHGSIFYDRTVPVQLVSRNLRFNKSVDYRRLFVCQVLPQNNRNEIIRKQMMQHELSYHRIPFFVTKTF